MSTQLHKNFTDGQVKSLFEKYSKKEIKLNYILQILKIKRSRFFELLAKYRKDPDNFSIQYERKKINRKIDPDIEKNIVKALEIEKDLIENKEIPIKYYNYSYIKDFLEQKYSQKVSLPTIIDRAKRNNFYFLRPKRKAHDKEVITNYLGGLLQCKEEGLIDHIVFSSHQPGSEIKHILEDSKMEGVLLGINILNFPYRWDGVTAAYQRGYGVVAMNPLFGGAIPTHEKELSFLASEGETSTEAALRFLISCPQISVVLNGFTTREHIDMGCRVADEALPFTDTDLEKIRKKIGDNMNSACTGCGYCDNCPQNIPVPSYMQLYNEKQIFDSSDKEMKKKSYLWGITESHRARANECIECGQCEELCTQHIPIIERLEEITSWENK